MESVEHLVIGAGPAGLRAAQVLADAGREVLVLERNEEIGPKTCGGGLSMKGVRELERLGLPPGKGLTLMAHASIRGEAPVCLDSDHAIVRTISRRALGQLQACWARTAGAEIRTATPVARVDLASRTIEASGRTLRYRHLVGADGSTSLVRRALRLPSPRNYYAAEFNVPRVRLPRLSVAFDSRRLANGYFWVFPHEDYTSIGAGAHTALVPPRRIRPYLDERLAELEVDPAGTPYEGATIEVQFVGCHFSDGAHLAGDAAGVASGLTAEGIYAAIVTGEEVARRILDPRFPAPKTRAWLRVKRLHDALGQLWLRRAVREASYLALSQLVRWGPTRGPVSAFFLEG